MKSQNKKGYINSKKREDEIELLECIYQNSKICEETIARIIKTRNKKDDFEQELKGKYIEYRKISNSAKKMLERRNKKVSEELGIMGKIVTFFEVKKNTENGGSEEEILDLLGEGSKVGVQQIRKYLSSEENKENEIKIDINNMKNNDINVSKSVINLANRLILIEESNIKKTKKLDNLNRK